VSWQPQSGSDDHPAPLDEGDTPETVLGDWEWRRRIRSHPQAHLIYRIVVGVLGLLIVVLGLILVPFPGPGWFVVLLGLIIWASEFEWAKRLLLRAKSALQSWNEWIRLQPLWLKGVALLAIAVLVAALFWLFFLFSGVPGFFPDGVEQWIKRIPGLAH